MTSVDVSVLIPSLQYGRFIDDALNSALGQRGVSVEVIVQDGNSTDETCQILQRYGQTVSWRSEPDEGQSDALNRALSRGRGRWVGWLNADEFYLDGALEHLVSVGETASADVVFGDVVLVDESGGFVRLLPHHPLQRRVLLRFGPTISSCGALFRRTALGAAPWDTNLQLTMDWDLYLSLAAADARFAHAPFPVAAFRLHDEQATRTLRKRLEEEERVLGLRYGVDRSSRRKAIHGKLHHALLKLKAGSYFRQLRAVPLRRHNLRWFAGPSELRATARVRMCYGRTLAP